MIRPPPRSTRTDTLFPSTPRFRSGGHLFGITHAIGQQASNWIQLVLATPVVLWAGWPFFFRGWQSLVTRNLNMFTLIAMGTGAAWLYSIRSEEQTSELQSLMRISYAVFVFAKKNKINKTKYK